MAGKTQAIAPVFRLNYLLGVGLGMEIARFTVGRGSFFEQLFDRLALQGSG